MDEEVRVTALVEVTQLPVIENQLARVLPEIKQRCEIAASLVVNEENYKDMKKTRAQLNKEYAEFKALIKNIKEVVMAPLNDFMNGICKEVDEAYSTGIAQLDGNIKDTENGLKDQKRISLMEYYDDYRKSLDLDEQIADPRRSGIKVGLTGSLKSYKEQAKAYLDRLANDIKTISTLENCDEIMAEYVISLDMSKAIQIVKDRLAREEAARRAREEAESARKAREEHEAAVAAAVAEAEAQEATETPSGAQEVSDVPLSPPSAEKLPEEAVERQEEILKVTYLKYDIYGTIEQLRGMKAAMIDCMIEYCEQEGMRYGKCE